MQPTKELIEQLEREEVEDARRMSFAEKFLGGAELFDYACTIAASAIRREHPHYGHEQVLGELRRRVEAGEHA